MRIKKGKKLISLYRFNLIDGIVKDLSSIKSIPESAVIENFILQVLLPDNHVQDIIENNLYSENGNVGTTISMLIKHFSFDENVSLLPLIEFLIMKSKGCLSNNTKEIFDFRFNFCALIKHLETQQGQELITQINEAPESVKLSTIYIFILDNWDKAKKSPATYQLLEDAIGFEDIPNNIESRMMLLSILRKMFAATILKGDDT